MNEYKGQNKRTLSRLIRLIEVVNSKGTMLSVSDKSESINEQTIQINKNEIPYPRNSPKVPTNISDN